MKDQNKRNSILDVGGEKFENLKDLQKHKQGNCSDGKLQCDECEKSFRQQKSLDDHMGKNHVIFACEECEKEFKYEAVLGKHRESVHEDTKFDCHYFNNDKECPFEDQCIIFM